MSSNINPQAHDKNALEGLKMSRSKVQFFEIPIRLESYGNSNEHWRKKVKRKKFHNELLDIFICNSCIFVKPPCRIILTRVAPRRLDEDNLAFAFKNILDKIGKKLMPHKKIGHADGSGLLKIEYRQEKGAVREYKIIVTLEQL